MDRFILESAHKKICIKGNNNNSLAVGLNHYLKYYCHTNVSWYASDSIDMPEELPVIPQPISIRSKCDNRFFLNYCTFGYTMPYWKWSDWERLIDWMALNGITMPLAISGQETVWYKVWSKLGLNDEQIRSYFTGPAHLPWHRMSNVDYWQSPLPKSWLEQQEVLQKQILKRERDFNMTPVLPAFSGHVPKELKAIYPDAKIHEMSQWGGYDSKYRSHFIEPMDSLFNIIQKMYLEEQTAIYGTDHIYGIDPFNEVDSPNWNEDFLAKVSKKIYESIYQVDAEAKWLQMTWMFYHDQKKWTQPRIRSFLEAVPDDKLILLDYYCDSTEIWRNTEMYYGKPYMWCYLGNFGGYWWLAKSCPLLSLLIVLNQHFIKSCTMRQNFDGTKMGQNRRKIKPRPLCSEYPYQNTLILNTKVQICPVINEPMSLFLSSITHFSIILYHGRFFKVLDTLFHILQLNNVFLIVVQCSERLPIIETAHLYTPFVRLDSDFSVVMKCVALFPSMANCHLKVSHKDVVNCMLNQ